MRVEDQYADVLERLELAVARLYRANPGLEDAAVLRVYEALAAAYGGDGAAGGEAPPADWPRLEAELFRELRATGEWLLGRGPKPAAQAEALAGEPIDAVTLVLCLRRLIESARERNARSGPRGYLDFMTPFALPEGGGTDAAEDGPATLGKRLNRAFGPIAAGLIIDAVDLATFGPIGLLFGLPVGGLAGYWMARSLGLTKKAGLLCALIAGIYCMIPFTEALPLATLVGAYVRFRSSGTGGWRSNAGRPGVPRNAANGKRAGETQKEGWQHPRRRRPTRRS